MTDNEHTIKDRQTQSHRKRIKAFNTPQAPTMSPRSFCGHSYVTQLYGGGSRFHCPSCDVRRNSYGRTFVTWTNGRTYRRFCNN